MPEEPSSAPERPTRQAIACGSIVRRTRVFGMDAVSLLWLSLLLLLFAPAIALLPSLFLGALGLFACVQAALTCQGIGIVVASVRERQNGRLLAAGIFLALFGPTSAVLAGWFLVLSAYDAMPPALLWGIMVALGVLGLAVTHRQIAQATHGLPSSFWTSH